jgi:type VI secretion system protein ImpE
MPLPDYVQDLLKANDLFREGDTAEARSLLDKVEEDRPAFPCKVDGQSFSDIRDYNDLTMCVFEIILKDTYVWVPFEQVNKIEFLDRKSLRDVFWLQAKVDLVNGMEGEMFLPSLYAGSFRNQDDKIRLGRAVDWRDAGDDIYVGEGTRLFWMDGSERSIMDIKTIEFESDRPE